MRINFNATKVGSMRNEYNFCPENKVYDFKYLQEQIDLGRLGVDAAKEPNPVELILPGVFLYEQVVRDPYSLEYMIYHVFFNHNGMKHKTKGLLNTETMIMANDRDAKDRMKFDMTRGLYLDKTMTKAQITANYIYSEAEHAYKEGYYDRIYGYLFNYVLLEYEDAAIKASHHSEHEKDYLWYEICKSIHRKFCEYRTLISYQRCFEYSYRYIDPMNPGVPMIRVFVTNRSRYNSNNTMSANVFYNKEKVTNSIRDIFKVMCGIDYKPLKIGSDEFMYWQNIIRSNNYVL
jgi:hypothetical protein